jgi:hypothetical protein
MRIMIESPRKRKEVIEGPSLDDIRTELAQLTKYVEHLKDIVYRLNDPFPNGKSGAHSAPVNGTTHREHAGTQGDNPCLS